MIGRDGSIVCKCTLLTFIPDKNICLGKEMHRLVENIDVNYGN
jgi:hypothetical protein